MHRAFAVLLVLALLPGLAWCGKTKVWNHNQPQHYEKAELKGVVMASDGSLRLARQMRPMPGIDAAHVWAAVEDAAGNLFAATGNEGKVFKIDPAGKVSVAYRSEDSQILALAVGADGAIYAGTGPSGLIVRIPGEGDAKVFCKTEESYVWSLAFDAKGETLFAGTGPHGRVLKINATGNAETFYQTKQDHILCVAVDEKSQVFVGTSKRGLVYRIDPQGKGFVLFDAPQSEIRSLVVTKEGVYAGTGSPSGRRTPATTVGSSGSPGGVTQAIFNSDRATAATDKADDKVKLAAAPQPAGGSSSSSSSASAPGSTPPASKENSVYRIHADGTVREIFREKAMVLGLLPKPDGLLIATGGDGQLFEYRNAPRDRTELLRIDHTQIHCLCQRRDGSLVLGAGDPGRLYVLENKLVNEGTITSEVLDAKTQSRWGSVHAKSEQPWSTKISFETRSGNVAEPDVTWSEWKETDNSVKSPPARFLQYRVCLRCLPLASMNRHTKELFDNAVSIDPMKTPILHSLAVRFQPVNVAPEVTSIEVPDLDVATLENPKKLRIKWNATDANEDDLTYRLECRKEGWEQWVVLETDWEKREYEWDSTTTPAGVYQFKVVASDRKDNPDEEALTHEKISTPFIVDHVAPQVTLKVARVEDGQAMIEAEADDQLTRLVNASFSVDSKKWTNVFPKDGLFDAKSKKFQFKTDELKPGSHVVVLRVTDAAGNVGSKDVVFSVPGK